MADKPAKIITPRDPEFGLPLPIAPNVRKAPDNTPDAINSHHTWHPSTDERLLAPAHWKSSSYDPQHPTRTLGGWALRNSRLQEVDRNYHNFGLNAYHEYYLGPEIPEDEDEQFQLVVLACAGLIPREGLDMTGDEPKTVILTTAQRMVLSRPGKDKYGYQNMRFVHDPVQRFLSDYVLRRQLAHISQLMIEEFLDPRISEKRRRQLGHQLLSKQVEVATEAVRPLYEEAQADQILDPRVPHDPQEFVKWNLLGRKQRQDEELIPRLENELRVQTGAA